MTLASGARLGAYEITRPLGAGGMGEVYRARDTKLNRDVAIKVLPDVFLHEPDRLSRFEREAHVLASLNHPNVAQIYGVEDVGPVRALVMELVEGPTLADRIARGALPLDEALPIAKQIADALEAAHEGGIIHRDLKPANIKVRDDGTVKVLDFGLAKSLDPREASPDAMMHSPTFTSPATELGMILGTAAYMAPEQAKGKAVDKRADIWAFGCVLYEMLTGKRAFAGEDVSETIASVLRSSPDFNVLPRETPSGVRRLLARCLERDPRQRLRDIGDARIELEQAPQSSGTAEAVPRTAGQAFRPAVSILAVVVLSAIAAAAAVWFLKPDTPLPLRQFELPELAGANSTAVEISPDGSRIAYVAGNHLWIRDLARLSPRDLGTVPSGTFSLAWSPSGDAIAFTSADGKLRTMAAGGGPPFVVCEVPQSRRLVGLAWSGHALIMAVWRGGLYRVDPRGGTPALWLAHDPKKEIDFHGLVTGPDGHVMFATHLSDNTYPIEMFDGTRRTVVLPAGPVQRVGYSATGHVLFIRAGANPGLWALPLGDAPLDPARARLIDARANDVTVGGSTVLLEMEGGVASYELTAVDRAGRVTRVLGAPAAHLLSPSLSPDGRRIAMLHGSDRGQLWIHDLAQNAGVRLTFDDINRGFPAWFPSGDRLVFTNRFTAIAGTRIAVIGADGLKPARELLTGYRAVVSPDGEHLLYLVDDGGPFRLRSATLSPDGSAGEARKVLAGEGDPDVRDFALSGDGELLAYAVRNMAAYDVFLTRFPSGEGKWHVTSEAAGQFGSYAPLRWARATNELFFGVAAERRESVRIAAVSVATKPAVVPGAASVLFERDREETARGFDVTPDGKTFFLARRVAAAQQKPASQYVLIQNWLAGVAGTAP